MTSNSAVIDANGCDSSDASVLLTGVTGFLGQELFCQLLTQTPARVTCLIRGAEDGGAERRLVRVVERLFGPDAWLEVAPRVSAVEGDVTRPDLGLANRARDRLARTTTHLLHGAASVRFDLPITDARHINVGGTINAADFAERAFRRGALERFTYVGTAFVSGRHAGVFCENDLDVGQRFRNSYEQSKFEAEVVVQSRGTRVPTTVVRPSIVIGHSRSGATTAFNVIYWPLRIYAEGTLRVAPAEASLPVDIVPVDFVARGAIEALFHGEPGTTYALAAGERATEARAIGDIAARVFDVEPPRFVSRPLSWAMAPLLASAASIGPWQSLARSMRQFLPYFRHGSRFDTRQADQLLLPRGIEPPLPARLLEPALEFARSTDFGRDRAAIAAREHRLARERRRSLRALSRAARS